MKIVAANDPSQSLSRIAGEARREPVVIREGKDDVAVVLSMQEYERLVRAKVVDFQAYCDRVSEKAAARGMTEAKLAAMLRDG